MSTSTNLVQMPVNESKKRKPKPKDRTPSVWNPDWKYTPAGETDLAKKFKRIERERKENESKKVRRIR